MSKQVRWGVLGVAKIAIEKVIPAMQQCRHGRVVAIASRSAERARQAATQLGLARSFGSYEALLGDPEIDAVYNPLPNHLHVPWSIRALEAGKHVLCEKPIALSVAQAQTLVEAGRRLEADGGLHVPPSPAMGAGQDLGDRRQPGAAAHGADVLLVP